MGVSISIQVYDYFALVNYISELPVDEVREDRSLDEFVAKVLPLFGRRIADKFIVLENDYFEEYDSSTELWAAVDRYFGVSDSWFREYENIYGANHYEVLTEVIGDDFDE